MPVIPLHSLTSQALDMKFANKQRRYNCKLSASFLHPPLPPPRLAEPTRAPNPTFEALRAAAAHLNLPGENEQHGPPAATLATRRHPVRKALLGATAALALCALAAGSYRAWTAKTPGGGPALIDATLASLAQRFRDLAANQAVFRTMGEKIALLLPTPPPALPKAEPAAPAAAGQADLAAAPAEPGAFPPAAAVASPHAAETAASAPPGIAAQQLTDTFALVRQMGLLVRDMQAENEGLRTQVAGLTDALQSQVADLEQRLAAAAHSLNDEHDENAQLRAQVAMLADTQQAGSKAIEQPPSLPARNPADAAPEPGEPQAEAPAAPASASAGDDGVAADAATTGFARAARRYRVQAASFGMAVLGDANAAPGQAGGHLVTVGDQVPGVGRVTRIIPRGTSWVVQTDHGEIQ